MCMSNLIVDKSKKRKETVAWKMMVYDRVLKEYLTPYQYTRIKNNKLKTRDKIDIRTEDYSDWLAGEPVEVKRLYGGAIHCFKTREYARKWRSHRPRRTRYKLFKVVGTRYVGENDTQIAFREIEFLDKVN